jgi:hypothetical protein
MKAHLQLTAEEVGALDAIVEVLSDRAKHQHPCSLTQLLHKWSHFVAQVERGYEASIYEYTNDLSTRDLLEEIILQAPQTLHDKFIEAVQPWDQRFEKVTWKAKHPVLPVVEGNVPCQWWFRVPKHLGKELKADLHAEGILNDESHREHT